MARHQNQRGELKAMSGVFWEKRHLWVVEVIMQRPWVVAPKKYEWVDIKYAACNCQIRFLSGG